VNVCTRLKNSLHRPSMLHRSFRLANFTGSIASCLSGFGVRERYKILRLDLLGLIAPWNVIYVRVLASDEGAGIRQ
jgi:hypothetical protein